MGFFNEEKNILSNSRKSRQSSFGVSIAILTYILIVVVFKLLGHWYSDNKIEEHIHTNQIIATKNGADKGFNKQSNNQKKREKENIKKTPNKQSSFGKVTEVNKKYYKGKTKGKYNKQKKSLQKAKIYDINIADSSQLVSIKGIGTIYARRIIKYRKKLGGYINVNQLKEIYGMTSSNYSLILPFIFIDSTFKPKTIPLWTCSFKELLSHPYCDYKLTKQLFNFRYNRNKKNKNKHLAIKREEFFSIKDLDTVMLKKLYPYLVYNIKGK